MDNVGVDYAAKRDYEWRKAIMLGHIPDPRKFRCDACGQYVAADKIWRTLITPDSHFSREDWDTLCPVCHEQEHPR